LSGVLSVRKVGSPGQYTKKQVNNVRKIFLGSYQALVVFDRFAGLDPQLARLGKSYLVCGTGSGAEVRQ
jgi:hypothetical protein